MQGWLFCILFLILAFTTGDSKSEYILPPHAYSVCAEDLDIDGDNDIVVGHKRAWQDTTTSISILDNTNSGLFNIEDTSKSYCGYQHNIFAVKINSDDLPDIVSFYTDFSSGEAERYIRIWYNESGNFSNYTDFNLNKSITINLINYGDINGDTFIDIVIASNGGKFWGVLYNDGIGNFNGPAYYNTEYWPNDLAVGDIDSNGREDIALCGTYTEIFYSFETGFEYFLLSGIEHSIELNDMDKDGDMDIITLWGAGATTVIIYENIGYQNFQQHIICSMTSTSGGVLTPDLNNDSLYDISFIAGGKFKYLFNEGQLIFSEPDSIVIPNFVYPLTYTWADLDNNHFPDIIVAKDMGIYAPNLKILFSDGSGNFGENPMTKIPTSNFKLQTPNLSCYPNPFTTETIIKFSNKENAIAEISIYNLAGKNVKNLINNTLEGGSVLIKWDGLDNGGKPCKPGPYLLTLKVNGNVLQTIKIIKY